MQTVQSGKDFFKQLNAAGVTGVRKGEPWGAALMDFAIKHPTFPTDHLSAEKERPLLLRPCEVLSRIAHASVLKVAHNALRALLQHRHVLVRSLA